MTEEKLTDRIIHRLIGGDGTFPNNERLPLLLYPGAIKSSGRDVARSAEDLFHKHHWGGSWRNGIFNYHHYHSTAHEVLGVFSGTAKVRLGGPVGPEFDLRSGDVVVIPAGVAHRNLGSSADFGVVGAYPAGQKWDLNYGEDGERPQTDRNIAEVPLPEMDPVFGATGPLVQLWHLK
jgi:uncharacterized protein YjlB